MAAKPKTRDAKLSLERVVDAAMGLADRDGIERLTIRALAAELDAKPMSLYHYVKNKEALLGQMVEHVFSRIEKPPAELPWKEAIRRRCVSARAVLGEHPWAVPLLESQLEPLEELLAHHEAVLATFDRGGFGMDLMAHAYAALDSYVYGYVIQEANVAVQSQADAEVLERITAAMDPARYPVMVRFAMEYVMRPEYSFGNSFEYGLDLLLDGLEDALADQA